MSAADEVLDPAAAAGDGAGGRDEPFVLAAAPQRMSVEDLKKWGEAYGVDQRQMRRWLDRGRERNDPCPVEDPVRMVEWIETHLGKVRSTVREKVAAAAAAAQSRKSPATESPAGESPAPPATADAKTPPPDSAAKGIRLEPIDLENVGGLEGQLYTFQSRVVAAIQKQLSDAYSEGHDILIGKLHHRLDKAGEQLRKYEKAAEEKAKRTGDYLPKSEVFNEIMEALNTLALMREHRKKRTRAELVGLGLLTAITEALAEGGVDLETRGRILEKLAPLELAILARIDTALDRVGLAEEAVLRNLAQHRAPQDVLVALAA